MEVTPDLVDSVYKYINSEEPTIEDFLGLNCDQRLIEKYLEIRPSALSVFGLRKRDDIQAALEDLSILEKQGLQRFREIVPRLNPTYPINKIVSDATLYLCVRCSLLLSQDDDNTPVLSGNLKDEQYSMLCVILELVVCNNSFLLAIADKGNCSKHTIDAISELLFISEKYSEIISYMEIESVKDEWYSQYNSDMQEFKSFYYKVIRRYENQLFDNLIKNKKKGHITHMNVWGDSIAFCVKEAGDIWENQNKCGLEITRMGEMCNLLLDALGNKGLKQPKDKYKIRDWLKDAEREEKIDIPDVARKGGRPSTK
ncbi:MAG: hypothetical protein AB2548_12515 [Candidatus Thiodiazotropha sp.]